MSTANMHYLSDNNNIVIKDLGDQEQWKKIQFSIAVDFKPTAEWT